MLVALATSPHFRGPVFISASTPAVNGRVWDWKDNRTGVGFCAATPFGGAPCDPVSQSASSFVGGGQVGARWQTGCWVLVVDGSLAYSVLPAPGSLTCTASANCYYVMPLMLPCPA